MSFLHLLFFVSKDEQQLGISLNFIEEAKKLHVLSDYVVAMSAESFDQSLIIFTSDLNRLIMDYLVIEGYKSAAEEFSQEANLVPPIDFESIESRMDIREALQRGDIEDAITRVNDLNPEVCSGIPSLRRRGTKDYTFHAPLLDLLRWMMRFPKLQSSI